jgi:hypothetical protein
VAEKVLPRDQRPQPRPGDSHQPSGWGGRRAAVRGLQRPRSSRRDWSQLRDSSAGDGARLAAAGHCTHRCRRMARVGRSPGVGSPAVRSGRPGDVDQARIAHSIEGDVGEDRRPFNRSRSGPLPAARAAPRTMASTSSRLADASAIPGFDGTGVAVVRPPSRFAAVDSLRLTVARPSRRCGGARGVVESGPRRRECGPAWGGRTRMFRKPRRQPGAPARRLPYSSSRSMSGVVPRRGRGLAAGSRRSVYDLGLIPAPSPACCARGAPARGGPCLHHRSRLADLARHHLDVLARLVGHLLGNMWFLWPSAITWRTPWTRPLRGVLPAERHRRGARRTTASPRRAFQWSARPAHQWG